MTGWNGSAAGGGGGQGWMGKDRRGQAESLFFSAYPPGLIDVAQGRYFLGIGERADFSKGCPTASTYATPFLCYVAFSVPSS
jgi:hypothetical protein